MSTNPYAPPVANVSDMDDEGHFQPVRVWSTRGRIGRLRFLAHLTGAYFVILAIGFATGVIAALVRAPQIVNFLPAVTSIGYLVFYVFKTIQRSHDMDWSGWTCILAFIPVVNLVWVFNPGTRGGNRFGAPPPPNTVGVRVLGLWFPVIFFVAIVGIIAAIGIPAYQKAAGARTSQTR